MGFCQMKKKIAIIPARGGSKRILRKNIKEFLGVPIIKYSIDAAIKSKIFDEVMVSTDDREIAELAISCGAKVPFMRSPETADDHSTTADVIKEVLDSYKDQGKEFDHSCCIYPTAPFITHAKLKYAYQELVEKEADSVVPVVRFSFPIQRSFKKEDGLLKMNWPEYLNTRSQDLPPAYHDSGQFYFFRIKAFLKTNSLYMENTVPYELPESEVQDIDNEEDWKLAEIKYSYLLNTIKGSNA
jgi:pseudaminic acid cytidylyltransferase